MGLSYEYGTRSIVLALGKICVILEQAAYAFMASDPFVRHGFTSKSIPDSQYT